MAKRIRELERENEFLKKSSRLLRERHVESDIFAVIEHFHEEGSTNNTPHPITNPVRFKAGRVTLRYAGRLYHLGIGRPYSGQKVTMVIVDKHITTALTATGEILTEHVIDETRDYQKPIWKNTQK